MRNIVRRLRAAVTQCPKCGHWIVPPNKTCPYCG
jgi:uncharacterized OB-fold protein